MKSLSFSIYQKDFAVKKFKDRVHKIKPTKCHENSHQNPIRFQSILKASFLVIFNHILIL